MYVLHLYSIHICVTMPITKSGVADDFINDVKQSAAKVMKNPKAKTTGGVSNHVTCSPLPSSRFLKE